MHIAALSIKFNDSAPMIDEHYVSIVNKRIMFHRVKKHYIARTINFLTSIIQTRYFRN